MTNLKDSDVIDFLLVELPAIGTPIGSREEVQSRSRENGCSTTDSHERSPLLPTTNSDYFAHSSAGASRFDSLASRCENLSALEIATVSGAKKFLGQRPVQKIINGLFRGDIIFWESLSVTSVKKPKKYNRKQADACELPSSSLAGLRSIDVISISALIEYHVLIIQEPYMRHSND